MIWQKAVCLIIGYLFGIFQTGYFIGKLNHIDIREHGSGNTGTTNTMRTLGKKWGFITFFADAFKAIFAMALTCFIFRNVCDGHMFMIAIYTGLGAILGHNFPFYMNFKGGKGIATTGGTLFALMYFDWRFLVCALATFLVCLVVTRYVSVGSMVLTIGFLFELIFWGQHGTVHGLPKGDRLEVYIVAAIITILSIVRHKDNIKRLINGTERKVGEKKEA